MSEGLLRCDLIPNGLFEFFGLRKPPAICPIPDQRAIAVNLKQATGTRNEGHFSQLSLERRQQFLGIPGGAQ